MCNKLLTFKINQMTVEQKLINMLVSYGMFESQAKEVFNIAKPILDKTASEINGTTYDSECNNFLPVEPYIITWNSLSSKYPSVLYDIWFGEIKPVALKWIDDNKPMAWFRPMFV